MTSRRVFARKPQFPLHHGGRSGGCADLARPSKPARCSMLRTTTGCCEPTTTTTTIIPTCYSNKRNSSTQLTLPPTMRGTTAKAGHQCKGGKPPTTRGTTAKAGGRHQRGGPRQRRDAANNAGDRSKGGASTLLLCYKNNNTNNNNHQTGHNSHGDLRRNISSPVPARM